MIWMVKSRKAALSMSGAIIGPIGEQMLQPRPALAHTVQDHLSPGAVGDVGGRQIDHQKTAVGVDRDVALATHDLLARVVSPCFSFRSFDRLAVDDAAGWARFASHALSVEHQRDIVDRLKHEPTDKSAKPPIDRLPRREIIRQHPPSPARTGHVADRVQHLPQIDLDRPPSLRCTRKQGLIRAHSSSVKSLGYRLVFFSILAIRPRVAGVHIPSLNYGGKPHSTTFQTDFKGTLGSNNPKMMAELANLASILKQLATRRRRCGSI